MLEGKYLLFCDSLDDVIKVRQKCLIDPISDPLDNETIHVIVYEDKEPIACGRMLMNEDNFVFDNIYVIEEKRNAKIGDFVLRLLIERADLMCAEKVYLKSSPRSKEFFVRFGFEDVKEEGTDYDLYLDIKKYLNRKSCCCK